MENENVLELKRKKNIKTITTINQELLTMLSIIKTIFNTLISIKILFSVLPIMVLIFIHYFIKGFINEHNLYYEDNSKRKR